MLEVRIFKTFNSSEFPTYIFSDEKEMAEVCWHP